MRAHASWGSQDDAMLVFLNQDAYDKYCLSKEDYELRKMTAVEFKPHDYQQYAIEYIETHEVAAVLLDMGLGKTAITLTALYDLLFDYFETVSYTHLDVYKRQVRNRKVGCSSLPTPGRQARACSR